MFSVRHFTSLSSSERTQQIEATKRLYFVNYHFLVQQTCTFFTVLVFFQIVFLHMSLVRNVVYFRSGINSVYIIVRDVCKLPVTSGIHLFSNISVRALYKVTQTCLMSTAN